MGVAVKGSRHVQGIKRTPIQIKTYHCNAVEPYVPNLVISTNVRSVEFKGWMLEVMHGKKYVLCHTVHVRLPLLCIVFYERNYICNHGWVSYYSVERVVVSPSIANSFLTQ